MMFPSKILCMYVWKSYFSGRNNAKIRPKKRNCCNLEVDYLVAKAVRPHWLENWYSSAKAPRSISIVLGRTGARVPMMQQRSFV
jgi:hypothetical protein